MNCHVDLAIANAPQQVKPVLRHDTADVPKLLLSRPLSHIIHFTPKKSREIESTDQVSHRTRSEMAPPRT